MKKNYKTLFSNTILFAIGSFGSKLIIFFLVPLYTNVLTTSQYGITELVTTSANLLIPFITLSINDAILRFSLDKQSDVKKVLKSACIVLILSSVIMMSLYPILEYFKIFGEWTWSFVIITIFQAFRSAFSIYLKSVERVKIFIVDSILYTFTLGIMNVVLLAFLHMGIEGYFIAQIIAMLISLLFQIFAGKLYKDIYNCKVDYKLLRTMVYYSIPLIANAVSWWVINSSDRYMLSYFKGDTDVGLYAVAAKMPSLVTTLTSIFSQAWVISSITEYENTRDQNFYSKIFGLYSTFLILMSTIVMMIIKPFMNVYVGVSFISAWKFVPCLLLACIFNTGATFFMALYKSAKTNIKEMLSTLIGAISNIILNFSLIPNWGIMGAVIATLISNMIMAIYCVYDTRRIFKFYIDFKRLLPSIFILIFQCVFVSINIYPIFSSVIFTMAIIGINMNNVKSVVHSIKRYVFKTV